MVAPLFLTTENIPGSRNGFLQPVSRGRYIRYETLPPEVSNAVRTANENIVREWLLVRPT